MKRIPFSILTLLATTALRAQQPTRLPDELRSLIQQANTNFPQLKQQQEQIKAGDVRVDIVRTALKPNVSGNVSYLYIDPVSKATIPVNGRDATVQFQPNHNVNAAVSAGQTLYDWGRTGASIRQAQDNVQLLKRSLDITQQNLGYQVAAAYYGVGFLQKSLTVQDSVIKTAGANVTILTNRLKNGDALLFDVLTQEVRVKTALNARIEQQNQLDRQLALLTYLTGNLTPISGPITTQFDATVQPFTVEGQLQTALSAHKDLLLAQARVRSAETEIQINTLSSRPSLTANASAGFRNGYLPNINAPRANLTAGVSLSVPIYSGKRYSLQNQAAQLSLNASRYAVETASAQLRQSLAQLDADIRSNQSRLRNLETQVVQARKALAIATARLRNGVITPVELESAETGVEQAELGQLGFQYQLLLNQLELKRLSGESLVVN
ncbi:MAG: TolC family protein [Bacteroidetes bacterium]|nr:TolC family protein [Fibrella sp.]